MIYISQVSGGRTKEGMIERNFGETMLLSHPEVTISRAFSGITFFSFDKAHDRITLVTQEANG